MCLFGACCLLPAARLFVLSCSPVRQSGAHRAVDATKTRTDFSVHSGLMWPQQAQSRRHVKVCRRRLVLMGRG